MKKTLILAVISAWTATAEAAWTAIEGIIPSLTQDTVMTRIPYAAGGNLVSNNGPDAAAVQSALGARDAGWYYGNRGNNTGTDVTGGDGFTKLVTATGNNNGGGFTALKCNTLPAAAMAGFGELTFSFDTGGLNNTSRTGQPQYFSLWYSQTIHGEEFFSQVGATLGGTAGTVANQSFSWEMEKSEYGSIFSGDTTFYLVLNSGAVDSTYAYQELTVSNFTLQAGVPEPSGASLALAGLAGLLVRRKREQPRTV